MKILIFSDLHLHPHKKSNDRLNDCLKVLDWVFQTAINHNIKKIIFAGDLFHDRQKIDVLTYQKAFEIFRKYVSKDLTIHLLLGNHDLWHLSKWDISSVFPLSAIDGVYIIDKPCSVFIENYEFSFLPYTHNPKEDIQKIETKTNNKVLFGHVAIDGALLNTRAGTKARVCNENVEHDGDMSKIDYSIFQGWNNVFLGHYHAEQKLSSNAEYIGSPLQLSYGEAFQTKHIIIFDLETRKKTYIENDFSPKHFILRTNEIENYDLTNNFIRIIVDDISSSSTVELRNELKKLSLNSLEFDTEDKKEEDKIILEDSKSILHDKDEMIKIYVDEIEKAGLLSTLDKEMLIKIGNQLCNLE